jgi:hypothetical protein
LRLLRLLRLPFVSSKTMTKVAACGPSPSIEGRVSSPPFPPFGGAICACTWVLRSGGRKRGAGPRLSNEGPVVDRIR